VDGNQIENRLQIVCLYNWSSKLDKHALQSFLASLLRVKAK